MPMQAMPSLAATAFLAVTLAAVFPAPPPAIAGDMMSACAPEIATHCADVSRGRGRVSACLVSHAEKLGTTCRPEVDAVARSGQANILVPRDVRRMLAPGFRGTVPASCNADTARFCADVAPGDARQFACLYARLDQVSEACSTDAKSALAAGG